MSVIRWLNLALALLVGGLLLWPSLQSALLLNRGYAELTRAGWESASAAAAAQRSLAEAATAGRSSALWGAGLLARWQGDEERSRALWEAELARSPRPILLLRILHPQDIALAEESYRRYSQYPLAGFWLGEALTGRDVVGAIAVYEEALALDGYDGVRWVELGWLYRRNQQFDQAMHAYDRGCRLRDRGGNGCWQAGLLSQELGLKEQAAVYYRLTLRQIPNYAPALERLAGLGE